jgi:hypothetical protein
MMNYNNNYTVPIVQGTPVPTAESSQQYPSYSHQVQQDEPYYHNKNDVSDNATTNTNTITRAPKQFQDVIWALAFYAHLVIVIVFICIELSSGQVAASGASYQKVTSVVIATGVAGLGLTTLALSFMMRQAQVLVQIALIFSVITSLAIGVVGFTVGQIWMGVIGLVSFAIGICYAYAVWHRIPFAAANLNTALMAVRMNMGLLVFAYGTTAVAFVWTILWFLGVGGSLNNGNLPLLFALFVSYYWVHQVLQNTMHVTTAGVVGTYFRTRMVCATKSSTI